MKSFKYMTKMKVSTLVFTVFILIVFNVSICLALLAEDLGKNVVFLRYRFQVYETIKGKKVEVWYKRDPKIEKYESKLAEKSGTGFVIEHNMKNYIVTAKHVAAFLGDKAEIVMNLNPTRSVSLTFGDMKKCKEIVGAKWFYAKSADIAIHPICADVEKDVHYSVPDRIILKDDKTIPLLSNVYVVGFPLGLGVQEVLSPIAKKVQIASSVLSSEANNENTKYILLDQALAQGYSGAPIYLIEDVMASNVRPPIKIGEKVFLAGILSMQLSDETGGKISVVVPSVYIWDIIQSPEFISYESNLKKVGNEQPIDSKQGEKK